MNWFPVLGLALAIAAPLPKVKPEVPNIVGQWVATGTIREDRFIPIGEPKVLVFELQSDGQFRSLLNGEQSESGTYKIDTTKSPAEIDLTFNGASKSYLAIFKIEKNTMTLSHEYDAGARRPADFTTKAGDRRIVTTFERAE